MNFKNLTDLFTYFKDEATCRNYLATQRWNGVVTCPFCNSENIYVTNRGFKCGDKTCLKKFSVTVGTVYENSKIPLRIWFAAIYLCTSSKKGVSSLQIHRQLGITQKSAWFLLHRVREMLKNKQPQMLKEEVQIDECYVGGLERNKHKSKRTKNAQGRSQTKTPVIGLYEKDGRVITEVVTAATRREAERVIEQHCDENAIMVTDAYPMYARVGQKRTHVVVNHSEGEYVTANKFHTNNIENFWSLLKRGILGIYHSVSPQHLHRYCNEFAGRYNTRKIFDNQRFELTVQNSEGRLKYNQLIGK
jgi:transposase-like protein